MMHNKLSYLSWIRLFLFVMVLFSPIMSGTTETDTTTGKKIENTSVGKEVCHHDIMAQCHKEVAQSEIHTNIKNIDLIGQKYIKCLVDYVLKDIKTQPPDNLSLKSRKSMSAKIDQLINHELKEMFAELYTDESNFHDKKLVKKRILENTRKITEELLTLPFIDRCGIPRYHLTPDEDLDRATLRKLVPELYDDTDSPQNKE